MPSRRVRRLRKALGLVQGEKRKFNKKDVTETVLKDEKHLHIPLITAERAWAYYMQLKFEANAEPRKKFRMMNRLRKAKKYADQLDALCADSTRVDARTKLETKAYCCWLTGTLYFETAKWSEAQGMLSQAKTIYDPLCQAVGEEEGNLFRNFSINDNQLKSQASDFYQYNEFKSIRLNEDLSQLNNVDYVLRVNLKNDLPVNELFLNTMLLYEGSFT